MKKGLLFATTLAMVLGVGVAVGAHQSKAAEVEAAGETTIYLDTNKLTWYGDQSRAYLYGSGGNNGWPGKALTHVSGSIYKLDVANMSNYQYVIFLRSNGTDVWNRTSKDGGVAINLPSNWATQNMWKFNDNWTGDQYDDGNYTGSWTLYTPPAVTYSVTCVLDGVAQTPVQVAKGELPDAPSEKFGKVFSGWCSDSACTIPAVGVTSDTTVYGKFNALPAVTYTVDVTAVAETYSEPHLYAFEPNGTTNASWPGVAYNGNTITVPNDATIIITDGATNNAKQTVNIEQSGVANDVLKILAAKDEQEHNKYVWGSDMPVGGEGYYIKGSATAWAYVTDNKMSTADLNNGDVAKFIGFEAKANDEIRVCSYYTDRTPFEQWASLQGGKSDVGTLVGDNLKFTADGTYDVYAKYVNDVFLFDVVAHAEPEPEPVYTIQAGPFISGTFELDEKDKPEGVLHQYSVELDNISRALEIIFEKDGVAITTNIGADQVDNNNIYGNSTDGFRFYSPNFYGKTKVYLKSYSDGGYSVWADHRSVNSFQTTIKYKSSSAKLFNLSLDETYEPNETYIEQYKTSSKVVLEALAGTDWDTSFSMECGGINESVSPEAGENNAMQAFQAASWKVHNDCEEIIYLKIKRVDLSAWLYVGGYEAAHVLTIGGKTVNLVKGEDNQYVAHGVALSAGNEVTSYTIEGEPQSVTSKAVGNNNLSEGKKVIANVESADIYYNVEAKTLWISGLPAAGQHLLKNGNTAIEMTHTDPYEGYDQYASGMLTFAANDTIKVLDTSAESSYAVTWCPKIVATSEKLKGYFVYDETNNEMKCVTACSAAVYLKIKDSVDEVYFGDVPEYVQEAVNYVNHFKSVMSTVCGDSPNKQANVEAAWSNLAGDFTHLSEQAQDEVKLGGYSIVEEIQEFGERYIAIKQQHPNWSLANFLDWEIPASSRYAGIDNMTADDNTMIIVVAIAAISALAFTTLLVFKKKKQK